MRSLIYFENCNLISKLLVTCSFIYYIKNVHITRYVSILPEEFCLSRQIVTPDNVINFLVKSLSMFTSRKTKI